MADKTGGVDSFFVFNALAVLIGREGGVSICGTEAVEAVLGGCDGYCCKCPGI